MGSEMYRVSYSTAFWISVVGVLVFCFLAFTSVMAIIALGPVTQWMSIIFLGVPGFIVIPCATGGIVRWMFDSV